LCYIKALNNNNNNNNGLTDLYEIWYDNAKQVSSPLRPFKNFNFQNARWRTAAILKTVKSPYICNLLTDFHEIWSSGAYWTPAPCNIFDNLMWQTTAILRIEKLLKYIL